MLRKFSVNVNGKEYIVEMEEIGATMGAAPVPQAPPPTAVAPAPAPSPAPEPTVTPTPAVSIPSGEGETIAAPMPGTILSILVKVGDQVAYEQPLVVLEAMKMENELVAPKAGVVSEIFVTPGAVIEAGKAIIKIV